MDAPVADATVDVGRAEPKEAEDVPRAPKRSVTELATRIRRNRAADPSHRRVPAEVAAPFTRQDAAPFLVH
jgi:F420-0:gamma-glutamyl ligase-like protein